MTVILQHGINFEIGIILIKLKTNIQKLLSLMKIYEIISSTNSTSIFPEWMMVVLHKCSDFSNFDPIT